MEELMEGMAFIGCGDCEICPYRAKCKEYSDYMKFVMGVKMEELLNERT